MGELLPKGSISTSEVLKTCRLKQMPSGDMLYISPYYLANPHSSLIDEEFTLLVSTEGRKLILSEQSVNLVDLPAIPPLEKQVFSGQYGFVTREEAKGIDSGLNVGVGVAVKRISEHKLTDITGFDQFRAMRDLVTAGFCCAKPLVATRDCLVSQWVDGVNASTEEGDQQLEDSSFISSLKDTVKAFKNSGKWPMRWKIDTFTNNFFIRMLKAADPLNRYILIDPIYTSHHKHQELS